MPAALACLPVSYGIALGLRHAAQRIFCSWPLLHTEDADTLAWQQTADGVGHGQARSFLPHDKSANVDDSGSCDDPIDRIPHDKLDAFSLYNLRNRGGTWHGTLPGKEGERAVR